MCGVDDVHVCVVHCMECMAGGPGYPTLRIYIYFVVVYFEVYIFEKNGGEIGMILAYLDDNRAAP